MAVTEAEIERLVVTINANAQQYMNTLKETERQTKTWSIAMGNIIANFATSAFFRATAATKQFLSGSVSAASDAAEAMSKFQMVFRGEADKAADFAEKLAERVGRSAIQIKDAMSSTQGFFVGLGFTAERARELSEQMQRLSVDFASFHNITDEEALGRFRSALSGSSEVLDQFGVNIKMSALQQEALKQGIEKSVNSMTEMEKTMLRVQIITRAMTQQGAMGDAERTADGFANQVRSMNAQLEQLKITVGQLILPVFQEFVTVIGASAEGLSEFVDLWVGVAGKANREKISSRAEPAFSLTHFSSTEEMEALDVDVEEEMARAQKWIDTLREAQKETKALYDPQEGNLHEIGKILREQQMYIDNLERHKIQLENVRKEQERVNKAMRDQFVEGAKFRVFLRDLRKDAISSVVGSIGGISDLFSTDADSPLGKLGKAINEITADPESQRIRETAGRAVLAGSSEAISLTRIGHRTVKPENEKRDQLLERSSRFLSSILDVGREQLQLLRDAQANEDSDVDIVDIPG